jgi:hypothetical protein
MTKNTQQNIPLQAIVGVISTPTYQLEKHSAGLLHHQ